MRYGCRYRKDEADWQKEGSRTCHILMLKSKEWTISASGKNRREGKNDWEPASQQRRMARSAQLTVRNCAEANENTFFGGT
jgi:hypothetical protein